jgi:HrpA-like RNA helicase
VLHSLNAVDREQNITALGKHMAELPLDVRLAKLLIFGAVLQCVDPVLTIAACMVRVSNVAIGRVCASGVVRVYFCITTVVLIPISLQQGYRSFFLSPLDKRQEANEAKMRFYTGKSDHLTHVKAFNEWQARSEQGRGADRQFCEENFLSRNVLREISELRVQVSMRRQARLRPLSCCAKYAVPPSPKFSTTEHCRS